MVKLINFFRRGGVYAARFLYSFPRSSMTCVRASVALSASPICLGHIVIDIFSFSVVTKYPALFSIRSTSLTFLSPVRCCPELTPRLSRCAVMSSLNANRGTICVPVPSKLQGELGELNEQVKVTFIELTATSAELYQWNESKTAVYR